MIVNPCTVSLRLAVAALWLAALAAAAAVPARAGETYAHDAEGRLTDATYNDGSAVHYTYDSNGNVLSIVSSGATSGVDPKTPATFEFALGPVSPNPGAGDRRIAFSIQSAGRVRLRVTDVAGRAIVTLFDRDLPPGRYSTGFSSGRWAAGVYFYRLESAGKSLTGRMVVER
jgi:YD repeat-containing protein